MVAHLVLFAILYGDPLYLFEVVHRTVENTYVARDDAGDTTLWTYFVWLFAKVYHVGLLGWLAAAAALMAVRVKEPGCRFVLIWGAGLLLIFSAFPISFAPFKFIAKQTNYMEIFMVPLALLAGWFLARQRARIALLLGGQ